MSTFTPFLVSALLLACAAQAGAAKTTLISANVSGQAANLWSYAPSVSADGRFVAFMSGASDLVAGDTNNAADVFVRDRLTGQIQRVSVDSQGQQTAGGQLPAISADGRYVAFESSASGLVEGDTNGNSDIFVHDRQTGATERVSVDSAGNQAINTGDVFDFGSRYPGISADGRVVSFRSSAANLVAGDTNGHDDIFVHDRRTGATTRASVTSSGQQALERSVTYVSSISADGRFVAFASLDPVFDTVPSAVDIIVHDRLTATTTAITQGNDNSTSPAISADGRFVAFHSNASDLVADDTNGRDDTFVHDRLTGVTQRVSVGPGGAQGSSPENFSSDLPLSISADGRFVAFHSGLTDLVPDDLNRALDVFVHDRDMGTTTRASVDTGEPRAMRAISIRPAISADGRAVTFESLANDLARVKDNNLSADIYAHDRLLLANRAADLQLTLVSQPADLSAGQTAEYVFSVSNLGPDRVASEANLTHVVGNGQVVQATPSRGSCFVSPVSVCRFGALASGESVTLSLRIQAQAGTLTQQASVNAPPVDGQTGNNSVSVETAVAP